MVADSVLFQPRRMVEFDPWGVKLGRQPPARTVFCFPPREPQADGCADGWSCDGPLRCCAVCGFEYCHGHDLSHAKRLTVPVDAWRSARRQLLARLREADPAATLHTARQSAGPLLSYSLAGRVRHAAPPVVVAYCHPPIRKNVDLPCCYPASTCTTGSTACGRCLFSYCNHHLAAHAYRFALPRHVGRELHEKLTWRIERAVEKPREHRGIMVKVPPIRGLLP